MRSAVALVVLVADKEQGWPGDPRPGWFRLAPVMVPGRRRRCRCPPGAGRVILRQLQRLDLASGLLMLLVAVVAVRQMLNAARPVP